MAWLLNEFVSSKSGTASEVETSFCYWCKISKPNLCLKSWEYAHNFHGGVQKEDIQNIYLIFIYMLECSFYNDCLTKQLYVLKKCQA